MDDLDGRVPTWDEAIATLEAKLHGLLVAGSLTINDARVISYLVSERERLRGDLGRWLREIEQLRSLVAAEGPVVGYRAGGRIYKPGDVTIIRA